MKREISVAEFFPRDAAGLKIGVFTLRADGTLEREVVKQQIEVQKVSGLVLDEQSKRISVLGENGRAIVTEIMDACQPLALETDEHLRQSVRALAARLDVETEALNAAVVRAEKAEAALAEANAKIAELSLPPKAPAKWPPVQGGVDGSVPAEVAAGKDGVAEWKPGQPE